MNERIAHMNNSMERINKTGNEVREAAQNAIKKLNVELDDWAKKQLERFNFTHKTTVYESPGHSVSIRNPDGVLLTVYANGRVCLGHNII